MGPPALLLEITDGPDRGRVLRYEGAGTVTYGRAGTPDADLTLPTDPRVGRRHLTFTLDGGRARVSVVEPKYQVWVDGRPASAADVRDGTLLALGDTRITVRLPKAAPEVQPRRPTAVPRRALSEFDLGEEIGRGGLGRVLAARDRGTGAEVAVKLLHEDLLEHEEAVAHFVREMDMLCRVQHEHVVKALAVGRDAGQLFVAMERLPGADVERIVQAEGPLSVPDALAVGIGILRALAHAHGVGVVHRDVKPHNVMLHRPAGGPARTWLLDFGLAKPLREGSAQGLTQTGQVKGTLQFAAPECLVDVKRATPKADLFSTAATLYWALTGGLYFDEQRYADGFLTAILTCDVVPLRRRRADVPAALALLIEGGLKAEPDDRWPSAAHALERLAAIAGAATA